MADAQALVIFGDGMQAIFYEDKAVKPDRRGVMVTPILISPSVECRRKYRIPDEALTIEADDGKKCLWMEYPDVLVEWITKVKTGGVMLVWCSFDGSPSRIMTKHLSLVEFIKVQQQQINGLLAGLATLSKDYKDVLSNQTELMRKTKEVKTMAMDEYSEDKEEAE